MRFFYLIVSAGIFIEYDSIDKASDQMKFEL